MLCYIIRVKIYKYKYKYKQSVVLSSGFGVVKRETKLEKVVVLSRVYCISSSTSLTSKYFKGTILQGVFYIASKIVKLILKKFHFRGVS